jgi:hypothetical protein
VKASIDIGLQGMRLTYINWFLWFLGKEEIMISGLKGFAIVVGQAFIKKVVPWMLAGIAIAAVGVLAAPSTFSTIVVMVGGGIFLCPLFVYRTG